ncbi:50S ribosomal protein L24 [Candidatus Mycoplasma haematominutum]|uniref:Large ribosomal subunit protein uL24 n=1 Tax=Candidatus Mycoplasma haematominutum 'Birmingham 1' TaxID=1116213 RepID=G8C326_9MOLU|nr:50S ribosomal protein L24 [Candidatus Mycoplasma haematominutum]CCE66724.1 ribosomal protein L24 [Candidatus Mycoplasma haematominutum 'Birmingham 1']
MRRLKKGDQVLVMRGSEKGKEGKIKRILVEREAAVVEGVYKCTVYKRGKGLIEFERPIHLSNLALLSSNKKEGAIKVSYLIKEGKKERISRKKAKT